MENDLREPLLTSTTEHDEDRAVLQQSLLDNNLLHSDLPSSTQLQQPLSPDNDADNNGINESSHLPVNDGDNPWKNHNVILSLALCVVSGIADSIWSSVVLSGFLLALAGKMGQSKEGNTLVGGAEAAQGLTQLVTALPVGYLADTWGKSKTVRLGGVLMLVTIGLTMGALIDVKRHADDSTTAAKRSYIILVIALAFWGIISGIANGPSQALFSDSVPRGKRSELLTWLFTCYLMSSTVGPIVSIALILTVSAKAEEWSINEIYPVFLLGVILEIPAAILMLFFNDKYSVIEEDEGTTIQEIPAADEETAPLHGSTDENGLSETSTALDGNVNAPNGNDVSENCQGNGSTAACAEEASATADSAGTAGASSIPVVSSDKKFIIPYVLFASSLISSLGSGASVKYFPLFFKEVGFGSAAVQGIFLVVPVSISCFSFIAQEAGKRFGRVETTVVSIVIGVSLLFLMTVLSHNLQKGDHEDFSAVTPTQNLSSSSLWDSNPYKAMLIVVVYLFRTGIINSCYPLLESILMDSVPSNQRARWKSLESIASFGWTGSALVGGILSDEHSYQFTFAITAWMQLASGLVLLIIQPHVERE
jgi:MFS family permease